MRKFTGLLAAVAMLTFLPATPAFAEGAVVDKENGTCIGIVPDENGVLPLDGEVVHGDLIVRSNKTWTTLTCHFDLTDEQSPPKRRNASGFDCYTPELTTDTRANASPGGRMVVTCRMAN